MHCERLPRTCPENTGFDSQGEQRLASAHVSTHESNYSSTFGESEPVQKQKKKNWILYCHFCVALHSIADSKRKILVRERKREKKHK
jgi:hypothetical protein